MADAGFRLNDDHQSTHGALQARVQRLQSAFASISRTRMAGLPVMHPGLWVEALGFAPMPDEHADPPTEPLDLGALGVLVTPWFMNLVWLAPERTGVEPLAQGISRIRSLGTEHFGFIGAREAQAGDYEMCSLFSPMFEFASQAAARATALAVLDTLRAATAHAAQLERPPLTPPPRRAFLFGRSTTAQTR